MLYRGRIEEGYGRLSVDSHYGSRGPVPPRRSGCPRPGASRSSGLLLLPPARPAPACSLALDASRPSREDHTCPGRERNISSARGHRLRSTGYRFFTTSLRLSRLRVLYCSLLRPLFVTSVRLQHLDYLSWTQTTSNHGGNREWPLSCRASPPEYPTFDSEWKAGAARYVQNVTRRLQRY